MSFAGRKQRSLEAAADGEELLRSAHRSAVQASPAEMAGFFQQLLGQQLTAYMTGVSNPKAVGKWARGERTPRPAAEAKLRQAFQIAVLISELDDEETARAWFMGMNPALDHRAPAWVIANHPDGGDRAMNAALAYLSYG
ncbi:MAG: XRE family transcriptional regulator [Thermomicrobiales bacterium]